MTQPSRTFKTFHEFTRANADWVRRFRETAPVVTEEEAYRVFDEATERLLSGTSDHDTERLWLAKNGVCVPPKFILEDPDWHVDVPVYYRGERGLTKLKARWNPS